MFKCSICGKEYSDKDMNEMRLLNRQTNELESFHVNSLATPLEVTRRL